MIEIPVRNLWLLQLFASDLYQTTGTQLAGIESLPEDVAQLVSRMLADSVTDRLRTGLTMGFHRRTDDLRRVRGKIKIQDTARHRLLEQGKIRCTFDEIHADTAPNRLVRAALERASRLPGTDVRCRRLASHLAALGVRHLPSLATQTRQFYRQRHLAQDREMLMSARLLLELAVPDPSSPEFVTLTPDDSARYLRHLFEKATYGFYLRHLSPSGWKIRHGAHLKWPADARSAGMSKILPGMKTDIILWDNTRNRARMIIIDTKFTSITKANRYGSQKLRSGYLYQIYAYLLSQHDNPNYGPSSEGLMLHPVVDGYIDEEVHLQGHRIRFATVDLRGTYTSIVDDLLSAVTSAIPLEITGPTA
ncbi:5-methylcytosine restriction system specificity protein McrC [Corynebacterium sp. A21]|uniref:5-methylcytosine restriction system specificity protein McrC n=1 Tax=Corynebacterium sp. A21 TaxID=3457318 RepID=UPI003FD40A11